MELTPRTLGEPAEALRPPVRRRWALLVVGLAVVAIGVIAWQAMTNAAVYFYNADEAVADREALGDKRFRLQGLVVEDSVRRSEGGAAFTVEFNDVQVEVVHSGGTPELFEEGIPVVLSGRWSGARFASDEMLIRHDENYVADNEDRIADAEDGHGRGAREASDR
ncbi:MAG: cytochrome c maturation protein CcmE [Acidimicrobiia bacterium]